MAPRTENLCLNLEGEDRGDDIDDGDCDDNDGDDGDGDDGDGDDGDGDFGDGDDGDGDNGDGGTSGEDEDPYDVNDPGLDIRCGLVLVGHLGV